MIDKRGKKNKNKTRDQNLTNCISFYQNCYIDISPAYTYDIFYYAIITAEWMLPGGNFTVHKVLMSCCCSDLVNVTKSFSQVLP